MRNIGLHTILFLLVSLLTLISQAQDANVDGNHESDSLIALINKPGQSLKEKAKLYKDIANVLRDTKPDSAFYYARLSRQLVDKNNFKNLSIDLHSVFGLLFEKTDQYDSALYYYKLALEFKKNHSISDISHSILLTNIGNVYYLKGDFHTTVKYYTDALSLIVGSKHEKHQGLLYNNLGLVHWKLKQNEDGLKYLEKAYEINTQIGSDALATTLTNFANIYYEQGNIEKVLEYDSLSLQLNKRNNNKFQMAINYNNIGESHAYLRNNAKAREYFFKAIEIRKEIGHKHGEAKAYINLAALLINEEKYNEADAYLLLALDLADEIKSAELKKNVLYYLKELEYTRADYKKALAYSEEYIDIKDSLYTNAKSRQITELMTKYETEQKEKENLVLKSEAEIQQEVIEKQNLYIILFIIGSFSLVIIIFLAYRAAGLRKKQTVQAEEARAIIEKQSTKLQELDRVKGRFFTNISHDIRSPLTLILGNIEQVLLSKESYLTTEDENKLITVNKNGKRLLLMADEIRDLTMLENEKMQLEPVSVNMVSYLGMLVKLFSSAADYKNIRLKYEADNDEPLYFNIDPYQFEKIVYNLLSNAIKYTEDNGEIITTVRKHGDKGEITIADNGQGIPAEFIGYVFDRYYQIPEGKFRSKEGLGVGLTLVKEIVHLHNGEINVESSAGKGTIFTITLPLADVKDQQAIVPEIATSTREKYALDLDLMDKTTSVKVNLKVPKSSSKTSRILLVEDHPEVREYMALLIRENYEVILANNGVDALKQLEKYNIDLVITDLMMPYMDGYELMDHLKNEERFNSIPILVVSARTSQEDKLKVLEKGVNNLLAKPFDKDELISKVANLIDQKEKWDNNTKYAIFLNNDASKTDVEQKLIQKLEQLVIQRISDSNLTVMDLAEELAASERQVYRMIKKLLGLTPFEYIKEVRLQYVEHLLKHKKVDSSKAAMETIGMTNVTTFANQFKKRFGKKPADYL